MQKKKIRQAEDIKVFHVEDNDVDLSQYGIESWIAVFFFWILGATVFYQFFTRYVLNDSAAWTEEIARYLLIASVLWAWRLRWLSTTISGSISFTDSYQLKHHVSWR